MTKEMLRKFVLAKLTRLHGSNSIYYIKYRDKMLRFSDRTWKELLARYVNENDEVDYKRLMESIRIRKV